MNKKVIFVADFFVDQVVGGGELNNEELIKLLRESDFTVEKRRSHTADLNFIKQNLKSFFIISNFIHLHQDCRNFLSKNANYIIYEHDHKYLASRNPATYSYFQAPVAELRNYFFYKNAQKVVCQSHFHKEIIEKNLQTDNVVTVAGNLWSVATLDYLRHMATQPKEEKVSIMDSPIPHKNTAKAQIYCDSKKLDFELIEDNNPIKFLQKLGKNKTFIFFPGTPETLSRIVVEARMMGMSVKTNNLVGAAHEEWFSLKGEELVDFMLGKRDEILQLFITEIEGSLPRVSTFPKVSVITTFYKDEGFLKDFLNNITQQTIFDDCELVIVDTGSPGDEQKIVEEHAESHGNIKYVRYDERMRPTEGLNLALKEATGDYVTFAFVDDRKSLSCLEILLTELEADEGIDLVYGSCLNTTVKNETFEQTNSTKVFDHSVSEFTKENMIKCLPGPMPMWRKTIHEKNGFFDQDGCDYADDWEMWLRAVDAGSKFKKVHKTVGLYLEGGRSQQAMNITQREEEAKIFYKYSHLFGNNFQAYKPYFDQFLI
jgi:GT2 family glycosyltransferase